MTQVRRAVPADREAVVATVVAAFTDDPAWAYLTAGDYPGVAPHFAGALFDDRVGHGTVWVTDDVASVSMWEPPVRADEPGPGHDAEVWRTYRSLAGEAALARLEAYGAAYAAVRPTTPHWYLGVLATHPDAQGRGLASAVLSPMLARADSEGLDTCLETSTVGNKGFYAARGFTRAREIDIPQGPPTWWLTREPQPAP